MRHYIVTRFNLGLYRTGGRDPKAWFNERFRLFSTVTMPSLLAQTCQNFTLIILIDADTPFDHRFFLSSLLSWNAARQYQIRFVHIKLADSWRPKRYGERWSCVIDYSPFLDAVRDESKAVLQTRLDNDDALLPDAVERIQANIPNVKESCCVDFLRGYAIDTVNKKAYYAEHPAGTPFISLYQRSSPKMWSIYDLTHQKLATKFPCIQRKERLWVMNIHDSNVSNRLFPWLIESECPYDDSIPGCI